MINTRNNCCKALYYSLLSVCLILTACKPNYKKNGLTQKTASIMEKELENKLFAGMDYSDRGDYKSALRIYDNIIEHYPDYERVYFERAMLYLTSDMKILRTLGIYDVKESAFENLNKLYKINPNYLGLRKEYSSLLSEKGKHLEAGNVLLEELKSPAHLAGMGVSPYSWANCSEYFLKAGKKKKATEVLNEYYDKYEQKVSYYRVDETAPNRVLIKLLLESKKYKKAQEIAEKSLKSQYKVPRDNLLYIKTLVLNKDYNKAKNLIAEYEKRMPPGYKDNEISVIKSMME